MGERTDRRSPITLPANRKIRDNGISLYNDRQGKTRISIRHFPLNE